MNKLMMLACIVMLTGCDKLFQPSEDPAITTAKTLVANKMKDPDSVKFRNVKLLKKRGGGVCGDVNAKNLYGAYIGYKKFHVSDGTITMDDPNRLFSLSDTIDALCLDLD